LHGDDSGPVDRNHNAVGGRVLEEDPRRRATERSLMPQPPYTLDKGHREGVLEALKEVSSFRNWALLAAHVRTTHVHVVVDANDSPEKVMNDFKSYASRYLNRMHVDAPGRRRWARHGSTRWLWTPENVTSAIDYVVRGQGEPMAVFETT
jgi:REP element-mobilizing transposase RayT